MQRKKQSERNDQANCNGTRKQNERRKKHVPSNLKGEIIGLHEKDPYSV